MVVGTNTLSVVNPKDTEIEKLRLLPNGGVELEGYKSRVNSAALEANREQYRFSTQLFGETLQQNRQMLEWLMRGGAQAYGINLGQTPSTGQAPFSLAPQPATQPIGIRISDLPPGLQNDINALLKNYQATNSQPSAQPK